MKLLASLAATLIVAGLSAPAFADAIPYGNPGNVAPISTIYATTYGITVYFAGSSAGYDNFVSVSDLTTGYNSGTFFEGHNTAIGSSLTLGTGAPNTSAAIDPGDQLVFYIESGSGATYSSIGGPSSADGYNHVYLTNFSGGNFTGTQFSNQTATASLPAGIYAGFEDSPVGNSDLDYNDDSLIFTGISSPNIPSATPEPSSLVLLGTGLLSACGVARRKLGR